MFILTEVDACALNCRHNVSNFRVAEAKMKRPLVSEGSFQCTFMACASGALWSCIEGTFSQTGECILTQCINT